MARLIAKLSETGLIRWFLKNSTPHIVVFLADILLVVGAYMFITYLKYAVKIPLPPNIYSSIFLIISVYTLMMTLFSTYAHIIRLSTFNDIIRLLAMVVSSFSLLAGLSIIGQLFGSDRIFTILVLWIHAILVFSGMLGLRILVKVIYSHLSSSQVASKRVIVLGTAINSIVLASAMKSESDRIYLPVALLDIGDGGLQDREINGMPIVKYDVKEVRRIFNKYQTDTLLFLATQIDFVKGDFANNLLGNGIRLLQLNQLSEFNPMDDKEETKLHISSMVRGIQIEDLLGREPINTNNPAVSRQLTGRVVLVTGAAGSIGSELVHQIALFGAKQIILFDQAETPLHSLCLKMKELNSDVIITSFIGDVCNRRRLRQVFELHNPSYVYHAAAYKHVPMMEEHPTESVLVNLNGTRNVADMSVEFGVESFVMISTDKAVNPTNVMGASKRIAEIYIQSLSNKNKQEGRKHPRFITTRFGNVLGSNGSVVPLFREQIANGGPVTVTHKDIIRYFMTIPEAVNLVLEAACMGKGGEIYLFDMGEPIRIYDLAKKMILLSGLHLDKDIRIVETGLRPGEKLYEELLNDKETTMPTHHRKIMIGRVREYAYQDVVAALEPMILSAKLGDSEGVVREMKRLVPEFISKNSKYEELDTPTTI